MATGIFSRATNNVHNKPFSAVEAAVTALDATPLWFALSD